MKRGDVFNVAIPPTSTNHSYSLKPKAPKSILKRKIKVRAPQDLPEGYEFKTQVKGSIVKATIPKGGVKKGDIFMIPYIPGSQ